MNAPLLSGPALTGVPVLETERLVLRAPHAGDVEAWVAFDASPRSRFVGGGQGRQHAWRGLAGLIGHWVLRGFGPWAITERGVDDFLGIVGPWSPEGWPEPEILWSLTEAAEGRGIAAEAARAARGHAFGALGWPTAVSYIHPENARSLALAARLGCVRDDTAARLDRAPEALVFRHPAPSLDHPEIAR